MIRFNIRITKRRLLCDIYFSGVYFLFSLCYVRGLLMSSLVLFSYKQPAQGAKFRWGVLCDRQDTKKHPLSEKTINGNYRRLDERFERSRNLDTVLTSDGVRAFYKEHQNWGVKIPLVGSLVKPFLAKK